MFNDLIGILDTNRDEEGLNLALRNFLRKISPSNFEELWIDIADSDYSISYWLYLANDINDERETDLIKALLYWKEFNGKTISKIKCLQVSDSYFYKLCVKKFRPNFFPCLIVSDNKYFADFIEINSEILFSIDSKKILGFLNSIHREISTGSPLAVVGDFVKFNLSNFRVDFNQIYNLISLGNLTEAMELSESTLNLSQENLKTIIMLKSEHSGFEKSMIEGRIGLEEYSTKKNRLGYRLLSFIQQIENRKVSAPRTAADLR